VNHSPASPDPEGDRAGLPVEARLEVDPAPRAASLHEMLHDLSSRLDEIVATKEEARARSLTVMLVSYGIAAALIVLGAGPLFGLSWTEAWWWMVGIVLGFSLVVGVVAWTTNRLSGRPGPPAIQGEVGTPADGLERLKRLYEHHFGSLEQVVHSLTGPSVAAMAAGACMLAYGIWEAVRVGGLPMAALISMGGGVGMLGMAVGVRLMARWWDRLPALQSDIRSLATEVDGLEPPDDPTVRLVAERMRLHDELDRSHDIRSTAWSAVRWGAILLLGWSVLVLLDGSLVSIVMMLALVGAMTASDVRTSIAEQERRSELEERLEALDRAPPDADASRAVDGPGSASVVHPE